MSCCPVGIFDSGLGGLSVWLELRKLLPNEHFCYIADSANCPYGNRSRDEIIQLSLNATDHLVTQGAKLIVVACNTATTAAIEQLRKMFDLPFVGIEPAVKPAAENSKSGKIGILATRGTLESSFYNTTKNRYASSVEVISRPGEGLVEAVESGDLWTEGEKTSALLRSYVEPMLEQGIDKLVLGCTHYPFLIPLLHTFVPSEVEIINPAPAVAKRAVELFTSHKLTGDESCNQDCFYTSGDVDHMKQFLEDNLGVKDVVVERFG